MKAKQTPANDIKSTLFSMLAVAAVSAPCILEGVSAFSPPPVTNTYHRRQVRPLSVASHEIEGSAVPDQEEKIGVAAEENVPYVIARGDGSTGGGGLPMPNASEEDTDDNGLRRPKVSAEMPLG